MSAMADWRERDNGTRRRAALLGQLLRVRAVYMRCVWVEALQVRLHDPELVLKHFVLLVCFASILSITGQAPHIVLSSYILLRHVTDVFDCYKLVSVCIEAGTRKWHTFREDLPFAGLRATIVRYCFVQIIEEILHFTPALPFCKFVADAKFRSATVVAKSRG
jgi:hypothetical protein